MKSILISIQPKWCELIASSKKTVEVRKTKPTLDTPFKVYIYCTKDNTDIVTSRIWWKADKTGFQHILNGMVIGEFVCDKIIDTKKGKYAPLVPNDTQIDTLDLLEYANNKPLYGWHISNLVIYDKPREVDEFKRACPSNVRSCAMCRHSGYSGMKCSKHIKPPQSWCYVEELTKGD